MNGGVGQRFQSLLTAHGSHPQGGGAEVLGGGTFVAFLLLHTQNKGAFVSSCPLHSLAYLIHPSGKLKVVAQSQTLRQK